MGTLKGINTIEQLKTLCPNADLGGEEAAPAPRKPRALKLVESDVSEPTGGGWLVITIPAIVRSEANESAWHRKMIRKLSAKEAVRTTLGPRHGLLTRYAEAYHSGKALRVKFVKLGGRRLDRGNLAVSLKAIEDAVEGALLANDGSPLWLSSYEQEPGGLIGVRVEIEVAS